MKRLLLTSAVFALGMNVMGSSFAADVMAEPTYDWSGFYIGGHVGYGGANYSGRFDTSEIVAEQGFLEDIDLNGIAVGAHAGYNYQIDQWVLGLEGDITFTNWSDKNVFERDGNNEDFMDGSVDLLGSVRGRAGIAFDRLLVFGTAGIAFTNADYVAHDGIKGSDVSGKVNFNDMGLVVGGGGEWALTDMVSMRVEGLYYVFNDRENASGLTPDSDPGDFAKFENAFVVRGGLSVHF